MLTVEWELLLYTWLVEDRLRGDSRASTDLKPNTVLPPSPTPPPLLGLLARCSENIVKVRELGRASPKSHTALATGVG